MVFMLTHVRIAFIAVCFIAAGISFITAQEHGCGRALPNIKRRDDELRKE